MAVVDVQRFRVGQMSLSDRTVAQSWWRIVPLLALALLFNYLDKVNIGFAALTMNRDLGLTRGQFGAGAGFFAFGYALAAIPSTVMLHRLGARRWLSYIMVAWALCSAATAWVESVWQLLLVRFLLGAAEAGFTPGCLIYFSCWFPARYRGRILGSFLLVYPLVLLVGGPAASGLLSIDGWLGLHGWQWLFIVEAIPSMALAGVVYWLLPDAPDKVSWLTAPQVEWLQAQLAAESSAVLKRPAFAQSRSPWRQRAVWTLAIANIAISTAGVGLVIFLPLILQSLGFSLAGAGWMVAVAGLAAGLCLPLWGAWSDRARQRKHVVAGACLLLSAGLLASALPVGGYWTVAALCAAMVGFNGCLVSFWTLPYSVVTGASAAVGIAMINVLGNLGTFTGPYALGWLSDQTQSFATGLTCLGAVSAVAAVLLLAERFHDEPK